MMKKFSLILAMTFITMAGFAQEKGWEKKSNDEMAMMYAEKMGTKMNLTAEQKTKIKDAQMKRLEDQKELMADRKEKMNNADDMAEEKADFREKRMKIQEDFKDDMQSILDENQYTQWETMHEEEMKMMKGKKMGHEKAKMKGMKDKKMHSEDNDDDSDDDNSDW